MRIISLEPGVYVWWLDSCDSVVEKALTRDEAAKELRFAVAGMDSDLAEIQVSRWLDRVDAARAEWIERVNRHNKNGPNFGTCKVSTIMRRAHQHAAEQRAKKAGAA